MNIILFDIDGTLISSGGAGKAALEAALASEFGHTHKIEKLSLSGRTDRAIIRDVFAYYGVADTDENLQRLLTSYFGHLPKTLASHNGRVLPGIAELLVTLGERDDVVLGLLTGNVRAGAEVKLGFFQLHHHFVCGGFGDQHFDRDDVAREALENAQRHLGRAADPQRVWVVGDTPLDVRCARAIGAQAVAVGTGWHSLEELKACGPDLLVQDLGDPAPLLAAIG